MTYRSEVNDMPKCKDCIHFKICNDYEYLIGRENKVACPDYKSTEDVVPRAEVENLKVEKAMLIALKEQLIEDHKCEVKELKKKINDYKKFVGEIRVTSENHAVIIDTEHTEYIDKRVAEGLKNMAVKQAKQDVVREIFEETSKRFEVLLKDYPCEGDLVSAKKFLDFHWKPIVRSIMADYEPNSKRNTGDKQ